MSMIGLASSPGTAVLPTWCMPPEIQAPIDSARATRSSSNRRGQAWSYAESRIGSSGGIASEVGCDESMSESSRTVGWRVMTTILLFDLDDTLMVESE
jgi:hypothetical protein